jgi:hypothetical protein
MSKSIKSNFQIYRLIDRRMNKSVHKTHAKMISDELSSNPSSNRKPFYLTSLKGESARINIRNELSKKLISPIRENYTYRNNMNRTESPFHKTQPNFNLNLFSAKKKKSYIKSLFKNFLNTIRDKVFHLFTDFESYFDLFLNENEVIKNSDLYQYDIFKSILEKFCKKNMVSKSDITRNNTSLNILEELLKDYIILLNKNTSSNCTKFISNFILYYKKIILTNYEIYSEKISIKDEEIKTLRETMDLLKERITNYEHMDYDKEEQKRLFEESKKNLENIIDGQSHDIENLKVKINVLEGQISIKDYKIKMLSSKYDDKKNYNLNDLDEVYEEKLDYDYLLKSRLEKIRYNKLKKKIQNNNVNDENDIIIIN